MIEYANMLSIFVTACVFKPLIDGSLNTEFANIQDILTTESVLVKIEESKYEWSNICAVDNKSAVFQLPSD